MHLMETHIDMMGREVNLHKRSNLNVVSLVPSQTELLYELGLAKQVIGQTRFCIHPEEEYKSEKIYWWNKAAKYCQNPETQSRFNHCQ